MSPCPKCNESNPDSAHRCIRCGASLIRGGTSRIVAAAAPPARAAAEAGGASGVPKFLFVLMGLLVAAGVIYWYITSPKSIEVESGIRISIPSDWKEVKSANVGQVSAHVYRGDSAEKTALALLIQRGIPQRAQSKNVQREGLEKIISSMHPDAKFPSIDDMSHDDVIHLRSILRDAKILGTPSSQLDKNDFKYQCVGIIVVNGDFIHYELAYDEQDEAYRQVMRSINALAGGH